MAKKTRRQSVDLQEDEYLDILSLLPVTAIKKDAFIPYTSFNFKGAVKWEAANSFRPALTLLLQKSGGANVNQASFCKAAKKFNRDKGLGIDDAHLEKGILLFRAIVSQMRNMVSKERQVPRQWRKEFALLLGLVKKPECETAAIADDADQDLVVLGTPPRVPAPYVEIPSESEDIDNDQLRATANPELKAILDAAFDAGGTPTTEKKKRIGTKSHDPAWALEVGGVPLAEVKSLVEPPSQAVAPSAFAALNKDMKTSKLTKAMKCTKNSKPMKAMKVMKASKRKDPKKTMHKPAKWDKVPFAVWRKRLHSTAYHTEKNRCLKMGMSKEEACNRAGISGRAKIQECNKMLEEGSLPDEVDGQA
eukprot:9473220-Pyramimonas_sp.AAC.1